MVYNFENYTPLFDETEFKDDLYIQKKKPYKPSTKLTKTTATILSSLNQKINTDYLSFLNHPAITIKPTTFFNKITVSIRVTASNGDIRNINTKVFGTGTVHMTGGKSIGEARKAVTLLVGCMQKLRCRVNIKDNKDNHTHPKYIYAVNDIDSLTMESVEFVYRMSNVATQFQEYSFGVLYNILRDQKQDVKFNPNRYAGIIYKVPINGVDIKVILFRSGNTTLSLGSNISVKKDSHEFINKIMKDNYDAIAKIHYLLPNYSKQSVKSKYIKKNMGDQKRLM
jgi:TATA-box binding protein (TBP) (component of TFIID and TFIIIB)